MTISATTQGIKPGVTTSTNRPTVPFDGQVISETDTDSLQVYKGSAWGQVSGLVLISSTTIGTAVSSVTVSNAFSATYDSYKIIVSGGSASSDNAMKMTFGSTTSGYYSFIVYGSYASNTVLGLAQSADTSFATIGGYETQQIFANIDVTAPFLTETTEVRGSVRYLTVYGNFVGVLSNQTSYTAFTLTTTGGHTWTGGTVKVYGYANS